MFMSEPHSEHGRQQQAVPDTVFDDRAAGLPFQVPQVIPGDPSCRAMPKCFYEADVFEYVHTIFT